MNAPLFDGDASADFYTITPLPMNAPLFDGDASDTSCLIIGMSGMPLSFLMETHPILRHSH